MESIKKQASNGFVWRFAQNVGTHLITFIVQIVLARILMPEDYGVIAMVTVFINVALVFNRVFLGGCATERTI